MSGGQHDEYDEYRARRSVQIDKNRARWRALVKSALKQKLENNGELVDQILSKVLDYRDIPAIVTW